MPQSLLPKDRKAGANWHPLWVMGCPYTGVITLFHNTLLGCSCLYLEVLQVSGKALTKRREMGNWRLEALSMLETVHCSCQWTWAWRHVVPLLIHVQEVHLFLYLKDLQLGYKLYEGKDCVSLAFWGVTKIKNSALHVVSAELIFVERMIKVLEKNYNS